MPQISFSQEVKNEIALGFKGRGAVSLSFLSAFFRTAGTLGILGRGGIDFTLSSGSLTTVQLVSRLIREEFGISVKPTERVVYGTKKLFSVYFTGENARRILLALEVLILNDDGSYSLKEGLYSVTEGDNDCAFAYVKGAFCGCGIAISGSAKNTSLGHIEFTFEDYGYARRFCELLAGVDIFPSLSSRREKYVVFIKDGDFFTDLLTAMGANACALKIFEKQVERQNNGNENRENNCKIANIDKCISASVEVIGAIEDVERAGLFYFMPVGLREAAEIRRKNPMATIEELAAICGISKSGMNHRLKKIILFRNERVRR